MKRSDVHDELTLLGVSSEVHALVDDLDLALREPPKGEVLCFLPCKEFNKPEKYVYQPKNTVVYEQGRLFEDDNFPVWQMRRMSRKKAVGVRGLVRSRSRKSG